MSTMLGTGCAVREPDGHEYPLLAGCVNWRTAADLTFVSGRNGGAMRV